MSEQHTGLSQSLGTELAGSFKDQIYGFTLHGSPFAVLRSIHPIAAKVLDAAIDDAETQVGQVDRAESERSLAVTLARISQQFNSRDLREKFDDEQASAVFEEMTREWVRAQVSSAVAATVLAQVRYCRDQMKGAELVMPEERRRIEQYKQLLAQLDGLPAAAERRKGLERQLDHLLAEVTDRGATYEHERPCALNYLLRQTEGGRLKSFALAAFVMSGNASAGGAASRTPVQILSPTETSELLGVPKDKLRDRVSVLRRSALDASQSDMSGRYVERGADLWVHHNA